MAINRIKVSNFKSFKELDLKLGSFSVVIGANASGKSNFTQIFKFLKDIQENTLDDAISLHGGLESLRNLKMSSQSDIAMQVEIQPDKYQRIVYPKGRDILGEHNTTYFFSIGFNDKKVKIKKDKITQEVEIHRLKKGERWPFREGKVCGNITVARVNGKPKFTIDPPSLWRRIRGEPKFYVLGIPYEKIPPRTLLIKLLYSTLRPWGEKPFGDIAVYDIDPHVAKNPVQIMGKAELQENGDNLALVLSKLIGDKEKKTAVLQSYEGSSAFFWGYRYRKVR